MSTLTAKSLSRIRLLVASVFLFAFFLAPVGFGADAQGKGQDETVATQSETGSTYTTKVDRKTEGELSAQDFRQVSTLASQIVMHVGRASDALIDEKPGEAKKELGLAQTLVGVIRGILPTTHVTTIVTDPGGKEVYRYQEDVQDDEIPLYKGMVAVNVLQAVVDSKREEAALKGVKLADAEMLHTSALLDLSYVERKINRALSLLEKREQALEQLLFAQSRGIRFVVNKEDHPLVKAQAAIRLAERMTREGKHELADENLKLAKIHLETYRSVLGEDGAEEVKKLQEAIQELSGQTEETGSASTIRGFWDRVTGWFVQEPGQAHQTTDEEEGADGNEKAEKDEE